MRAFFRNWKFQDKVVLAFLAALLLRALLAEDGRDATTARLLLSVLFAIGLLTIVAVRGEFLPPGSFRAVVYRVGLFAPVSTSYLTLRYLLPALQPDLLDTELRALDESLLGVTPAEFFARWNTPFVTEWFAFFYYLYFTLMLSVLLPSIFFDRGRRLREIMVGAMLVACIGHFTYTLVPGGGPVLAMDFAQPLRGGFFWRQVIEAVDGAGAHLDIFPSLHTAYPTFFALHAYAWRHTRAFRYVWVLIAFCATQMVLATLFLRWHWFVDVLAGLMLASLARYVAVAIARMEALDADRGLQPVWEEIWPRSLRRRTLFSSRQPPDRQA